MNKIQNGLELVTKINPQTKLYYVNEYINKPIKEQPEDKNIYWSINGHKKGGRTKKDLEYIYCFGIDVDNKKKGIPDSVVIEKLDKLEKEYNLSPNLINETNGGYHIIFAINKTAYRLYHNIIPIIYQFLNSKLDGDVQFKWITGIMKLPYSNDCKTKKEIRPIKIDFSYRYI